MGEEGVNKAEPFSSTPKGKTYSHFADHVAEYMAQTFFHTSTLSLDTATYRLNVAKFSNNEMCRLTEQVWSLRCGPSLTTDTASVDLLLEAGWANGPAYPSHL